MEDGEIPLTLNTKLLLRKLVPTGHYAHNIATLMTGTGLAQAIPIVVSPILTRLYGPESFGIYALYVAIVSIAAVLVTGRYEVAVLLPKQDRDALHVAVLSILLSCSVSALLFLATILFGKPIARWLGAPGVAPWLYWVPASTLLTGVYQSISYWHNRNANYRRLALSRVVQSGSGAASQVTSGYAGSAWMGLIGGQLAGQLLSTISLAYPAYKTDSENLRHINRRRLLLLARKYVSFPKYLTIGHSLNTAASQMPVLILTALFGATTAGFYMLAQRVIAAPVALVAGAAGDVFRQEASAAYVRNGNCLAVYKRTFARLFVIAVPACVAFFFLAPPLFSTIFGAQWVMAGEYAQILTPVLFFTFVLSPLSSTFMIAEKQKLDLYWQVVFFCVSALSLASGFIFTSSTVSVTAFSISYSIMFIVNGVISYTLAAGSNKPTRDGGRRPRRTSTN